MRSHDLAPLLVLLLGASTPACSKATTEAPPTTSADASPAAPPATLAGRPSDSVPTSGGPLLITPIHHATLVLTWGGKTVVVDPWSEGNLEGLPKADVVLLTDIHGDHLDPKGLEAVRTPATVVVAPPAVAEKVPGALVLQNGETKTALGLPVEAVPMYNLKRGPKEGVLFHDKGRGNGYVVTFGDKRVYIAGDTECTPEMRALKNIDVAFVPMNLPYTMPPSEAAECVKAFRPKIVYPFHYRGSDLGELKSALAGEADIEVRLREWY